ncbi:D-xylose transport system substrate-binding protein [Clostridium cavendishii DSM 21758]|uniref:D-xylose transport system substrate-binding protein n=1 Tax=Clostridium cavendishii DSM 21758 TaxID=1121302 RepID=A0A1M6NKZ6_9CLOT|nr:substrate-binding domain-containing protein [Clostridium cavendishii]SHJ96373.1 D-xylose transport system substrate-binding protein [Clostridium cavendishii DSM 21758]
MYLSIPNGFIVPVYYVEQHVLDIGKKILQEHNSYRILTDEIIDRKDIVIGVSFGDQITYRWKRQKIIMEEYAKTKGVTLKIENADADAAKQAQQVEKLISEGIDVLILVPVDSYSAAELVDKAHKSGVKIVDYTRLIQNSDVDLYISYDGLKIGELQGQYLIKTVPKGNYIILSGDPDNFNSKLYKEGAMKYITPLANIKNIKIVADKPVKNWDSNIAFKIVEEALIANNNKIDAILAPNDLIAGGAIDALKAQGLAGRVVVTGKDADLEAAQRIVRRTQSMTVFNDPREEAYAAIEGAINLANNKPIDVQTYVNTGKTNVPAIILTPIVIDKNNINSVLIDSGYLKQNEVYAM